jgi:hypothetical protein
MHVVLNDCILSYADGSLVAAQNDSMPKRRAFSDYNVSNDDCIGSNPVGAEESWVFSV